MSRLHRLVVRAYPPRPPALLRITLGGIATVRGLEAIRILWPLTDDVVVHVPYVWWMPEPSQGLIALVLVVWLVAAVLFMVGLRTQIAGSLLAASMAVGLLVDQQAYSNHLYLLIVLVALLTLARPGAVWSFDARFTSAPANSVMWPIVLIKSQISIVYLFAAFTKLNAEYLSGKVIAAQLGQGFLPFPSEWKLGSLMAALAITSVAIELLIAGYLWHPQRRFIAIGAGVLLHGSIPLLMRPFVQLAVFSAIMLASYVLFIPPEPGERSLWAPRQMAHRIRRLDWLRRFNVEDGEMLVVERDDEALAGWRAITSIADEIPATFLVSPFLRLPLVRSLTNRLAGERSGA